MKIKTLTAGAAVAALTFGAPAAHAFAFYTTPSNNMVFDTALEGWVGANLSLIADGPVTARLSYYGFASLARNAFVLDGLSRYVRSGGNEDFYGDPSPGTGILSIGVTLNAGLLDFQFLTSIAPDDPANNLGVNPLPATNRPNFFVSFGDVGDTVIDSETPLGGRTVVIAFDDSGAGSSGRNYDDLVVRITLETGTFAVVTVPEPASLALLGAGVLGLGFAARRRRSA